MKGFIEKLLYILLLFSVFIVCLFGMAFIRNATGLGMEWQMLIAIFSAALWHYAEKHLKKGQ